MTVTSTPKKTRARKAAPETAATEPAALRQVSVTYGYRPGDDTALTLPTADMMRYHVAEVVRTRRIDPMLERDIAANGIREPLRLHTNGLCAVLAEGNQRLAIANELGIEHIQVQIIPDSLRRPRHDYCPPLHPELLQWVQANLWCHETHDITRHLSSQATAGIAPHRFVRCVCSCGATWKEDA